MRCVHWIIRTLPALLLANVAVTPVKANEVGGWVLPPITEPPGADPAPKQAADASAKQARLELARLLAERGRYDEAITEYRRVLQDHPDVQSARLGLARTRFWSGDTAGAAEEIEGIDTAGLSPQERLFVADLHLSSGDYEQAIELYERHLQALPEDHEVRYRKALALAWSERYAAAINAFDRLHEAAPEDRQLMRQFAQVLTWADQPDRAIELLQKSLED